MNQPVVISYAVYLLLSIGLTIWVAGTLHRHGRVFLVEAFAGNEGLADSVNHLLVVGFYLINIGYIALALRYGEKPGDVAGAMEFVSTKVGLVLLVLGAMHFANLFVFHRMRAAQRDRAEQPPVEPDERLPVGAAATAKGGT